MNVDCQWIEKNLEALFCDKLPPEQDRLARTHIEACAGCREEVRELVSIDAVIKNYLQSQIRLAKVRPRRRSAFVYGTVTAAGLASLVIFAFVLRSPQIQPGSAPQNAPAAESAPAGSLGEISTTKKEVAGDTTRAKPQPVSAASESGRDLTLDATAPEFLVADPAGYAHTLSDYRGFLLLFGVWSDDHPEMTIRLEQAYQQFGSNVNMRVLGIPDKRQPKPSNTTFPIAYNQGSRLLDAKPGDFVLIGKSGDVRFRGSSKSTSEDELTAVVRSALQQ